MINLTYYEITVIMTNPSPPLPPLCPTLDVPAPLPPPPQP